ncbi:hypothetical protein C1701_19015 [Actinoalloteichus sp. AHMU CJ021]|uniref:YtxH domain-containing protein n=1 Tax=Actinoalloteichus caeruleus DSM 43889 TaxID=1120930 RepID=A0ABT1JP28_ACTCY|nr:hypothetical protein [Actinoalloteichus caeruleus]AUS80080.1 hypothetical protein C1701_19015 [Actinoalloteichus sp. AHMU CJ021]MCP2334278.1 hypothetical protein [Actinoalloteichus caeruleus DSM 43889]
MIKIAIGAAVGYVLGAKAGRARYEQLVRAYQQVVNHPTVRTTVDSASAKVRDLARRTSARYSETDI